MENNINDEIKFNISGHVKMYHNGELFFDKPNTITNTFKRYLTESFYVSNATSKFIGPDSATVPAQQGGNALISGVSTAELNINRIGTGGTTPNIDGKGGIFISKNAPGNGASGNIMYGMNTSLAIITNVNPRGRQIKFTGTFVKDSTAPDTTFTGAAIAFGCKVPTGGPDASAQPKAAGDTATYNNYILVYTYYDANVVDGQTDLVGYSLERTNRPIAYQTFSRELRTGDTLTIDWTITVG
jgi:hypothetical protein